MIKNQSFFIEKWSFATTSCLRRRGYRGQNEKKTQPHTFRRSAFTCGLATLGVLLESRESRGERSAEENVHHHAQKTTSFMRSRLGRTKTMKYSGLILSILRGLYLGLPIPLPEVRIFRKFHEKI
jgi:hypothetical protein